MNDRFQIDSEPLVRIDSRIKAMTVPHCVRCRVPLEPGVVYARPGPFCEQCIDDIIASARSFGGGPCDMVERYNSKLSSFIRPGDPEAELEESA